ncbi:LamG domain-containing protein [Tabrizicola fusiformis]|uniref:hypothetical protein n=1 Tax=Tabrizicola sp. SY72 TaxID=2741673 RepID=UPI0015740E1F|nr:hypothetical protein [Tabrizicola sp. SY72]NTT88392.1 hypothetical protein [Tabrizicola sp. SY72]
MSQTIVRQLPGVFFNNPALPRIALPGAIAVIDGLIGAYRFAGAGYLSDLSGSGRTLTAVGAPVVAGGYATCSDTAYFDTGITQAEGDSYSLLITARLSALPAANAFIVGNLETSVSGCTVFYRTTGRPYVQSRHMTNTASNDMIVASQTEQSILATTWTMQSLRHSGRVAKWDIPRSPAYSYTRTAGDLTTRYKPGAASLRIGRAVTAGDTTAGRQIAEVLIYNRMLSDAEVTAAYAGMAAYAATVGITGI